MPNCYTLTPVGGTEPESLSSIDEKICAHFGAEPHPKWYYSNWESNIGGLLALGKSWDEIKDICRKENSDFGNDLLKITEFLETRYTPDAWAEIGRR